MSSAIWPTQPEFVDYLTSTMFSCRCKRATGCFNPALFHAAGNNTTTDHVRTANLLQISSAFGVPMEDVNHELVLKNLSPASGRTISRGRFQALIAVLPGLLIPPTNLDTDPPLGGMVPKPNRLWWKRRQTGGMRTVYSCSRRAYRAQKRVGVLHIKKPTVRLAFCGPRGGKLLFQRVVHVHLRGSRLPHSGTVKIQAVVGQMMPWRWAIHADALR